MYPPAETKIPIRALLSSLLPGPGQFGEDLCGLLGVEHCVLGSSGRALLTLLLRALREKGGHERDEVLIPGYTCYSLVASTARAGLKVKVFDLNPRTFGPDLESVEKAGSSRTLAVITQHIFGIPTKVLGVKNVSRKLGAYLIEDAAQALGGALDGCILGTLGDFGLYSFGRGKPLPLGSGGALVAKEIGILQSMETGKKRQGYLDILLTALSQILSDRRVYRMMETLPLGLGKTVFDPDFEMAAMPSCVERLGQGAIDTLESLNDHRRRVAETYKQAMSLEAPPSVHGGSRAVYLRFPVVAGEGAISKDLRNLGVRRMYPQAIRNVPEVQAHTGQPLAKTPGAEEIARKLVTLPTHLGISEGVAKTIGARMKACYGSSLRTVEW